MWSWTLSWLLLLPVDEDLTKGEEETVDEVEEEVNSAELLGESRRPAIGQEDIIYMYTQKKVLYCYCW